MLYLEQLNEFAFQSKNSDIEHFANLFADSQTSGKLANFTITDFGSSLKKAQVSFGQVNLGIYKRGPRSKPTPIFHDKEKDQAIYHLFSQLRYKGHYYASLRNFKNSIIMNFTPEDFARGLYFSTWTFNNKQSKLKFSFTSWTSQGKKCVFDNCQSEHFYQTVPISTSSFLAEKRIAKKRLQRELEGVNDLFATAIATIQKVWQPTNFKWVAVPELHKCQTLCHWQGKKTKKKGWKNHEQKLCHCPVKHECLRNWHIHMLSTDFLPAKYAHKRCGLGQYSEAGSPSGCWDHRGYIAHDIWPYGLVDMKRVSHLKVSGKPIHSAEAVIAYLVKYLAKSFQMRENKSLADQVGLLPSMGIYKFFRVIYGYDGERTYIQEKRKKPLISSQVFINNDYGFTEQVEKEFSPCFTDDLRLKKNAQQILKEREPKPPEQKTYNLTETLKLCLRFCSHSSIKKNQFWKPCDTSEDPIWIKGQGWITHCPIHFNHHTEPIIRWAFEFNGAQSYQKFHQVILPTLSALNLPTFSKFTDYQIREEDYLKFANQAKLPWNKEINQYELDEESGQTSDSSKWRANIPFELLYNHIYLKEIRSQISLTNCSWGGLPTEQAQKRYADY